MKNVAIILIVIISILFSGCDNIPIRSEDEDREEITSEETEASEDPSASSTSESSGTPAPTTEITTATTETTASVTTAETTPEPTADPNAFIYGGITIIYDFFEGEYTDTDDDTSLASGYLQNLTVEIPEYPAAAELINETLEAIRAQSAATYESACLDAQAVYDDYGMDGLAGPYEVNAAVEPAYVSDKLISFFVSVYTYYGGAHGGVIVEAYTFDARSGDYLTFSDLCTDPAAFEHYVQTNVIAFIEAVPRKTAWFSMITQPRSYRLFRGRHGCFWMLAGIHDSRLLISSMTSRPMPPGCPATIFRLRTAFRILTRTGSHCSQSRSENIIMG